MNLKVFPKEQRKVRSWQSFSFEFHCVNISYLETISEHSNPFCKENKTWEASPARKPAFSHTFLLSDLFILATCRRTCNLPGCRLIQLEILEGLAWVLGFQWFKRQSEGVFSTTYVLGRINKLLRYESGWHTDRFGPVSCDSLRRISAHSSRTIC